MFYPTVLLWYIVFNSIDSNIFLLELLHTNVWYLYHQTHTISSRLVTESPPWHAMGTPSKMILVWYKSWFSFTIFTSRISVWSTLEWAEMFFSFEMPPVLDLLWLLASLGWLYDSHAWWHEPQVVRYLLTVDDLGKWLAVNVYIYIQRFVLAQTCIVLDCPW